MPKGAKRLYANIKRVLVANALITKALGTPIVPIVKIENHML